MAQQTVKAETFFTPEDDGLAKEWHGNVWLNPPYHRELQPLFVDKLVAEVKACRVKQAIMLTNNSTDTEWFRKAAEAANAICFTYGRVAFTTPGGEEVAPTQGQAFFYFGPNVKQFAEVFRKIRLRHGDDLAACGLIAHAANRQHQESAAVYRVQSVQLGWNL
jgi:ParB family chromosome partitioning protein